MGISSTCCKWTWGIIAMSIVGILIIVSCVMGWVCWDTAVLETELNKHLDWLVDSGHADGSVYVLVPYMKAALAMLLTQFQH